MARQKKSPSDKTNSAQFTGKHDDGDEAYATTGKEATSKKKRDSRKNASPKFNYEVATITAILMSDRLREIRKLGTIPHEISDPSWDNEFAGAMKRAELVLRRLTSRDYDVHAYQVFPEGAKFTAEQISEERGGPRNSGQELSYDCGVREEAVSQTQQSSNESKT